MLTANGFVLSGAAAAMADADTVKTVSAKTIILSLCLNKRKIYFLLISFRVWQGSRPCHSTHRSIRNAIHEIALV
jgi:hypothetical protein